ADAGKYANNMSMIAFVKDNLETEYEIGAFVGEELRGSARPIYIETLDSYLIFMTIYGESNEEVTFIYYDVNADEEETVFTKENVIFSTNATYGSVDNPIAMMFDTEGIGENLSDGINIYPNPANVNSEINLGMTCDRVEIYNTIGVKIAEYSNVNKIDGIETSGVYMIRLTNGEEAINCRIVVE
ncbi:MAG: T9SS type A sorting domain-containing protein, partial [Bacteroidales bacterium]|nr:T9SS type A sorting domain-containing protein [Bacteroidales bacterium]